MFSVPELPESAGLPVFGLALLTFFSVDLLEESTLGILFVPADASPVFYSDPTLMPVFCGDRYNNFVFALLIDGLDSLAVNNFKLGFFMNFPGMFTVAVLMAVDAFWLRTFSSCFFCRKELPPVEE